MKGILFLIMAAIMVALGALGFKGSLYDAGCFLLATLNFWLFIDARLGMQHAELDR